MSASVSKEMVAGDNVEYVYLTVRESSNTAKGHCIESGGQQDDIWQYANYTASAAEAATPLQSFSTPRSGATVVKRCHLHT